MAKQPGDKITFTKDDITYGGIVIKSFEDSDSEAAVQISVLGSDDVIQMKESDLNE